ncbi:MAG: Cell division protein FtsI [Labilithrix sp.]|nr:Cell division protein FtsI [Labilithrix sp.]
MRRRWIAAGVGVPLVVGAYVLSRSGSHAEGVPQGPLPSITRVLGNLPAAATAPPAPLLAGLDLTKLSTGEGGVTAPLAEKRTAHLTVDPVLQKVADRVMSTHHVPEASVVLMDVQSGKILVYASHLENAPPRDLAVEATAPAASVFKIITASALVEHAGMTADQRQCYSGGEQRLTDKDLVADPKRDRWCTTLGGAMGRSINTVFARLALNHLKPASLEAQAKLLGFGAALPFDVPVQPSAERFPEDTLGFARTAAGFWNTTLSPLHAAWLSATMARGGEPVRPVLVSEVSDDAGKIVHTAQTGLAQKRVLRPSTAEQVTTMMESTVSDGTSYRAFHDPKGQPFLPNVTVAGKTGTLTDNGNSRFYTWFTGFAPSRAVAVVEGETAPRQVAIGVLVVNRPTWTIKANVLAREVLRAYFAEQKVPNVTMPASGDTASSKTAAEKKEGGDQPSTTPPTKHRRQRGS